MTFEAIRKDFFVNNIAIRRKSWPDGEYWRFSETTGMITKHQLGRPKGFLDAHEWAINVFDKDDWEWA